MAGIPHSVPPQSMPIADDGVPGKLRDLALNVAKEFGVCEPGEPSWEVLRESDVERGESVKKARQWIYYDVTGFKAEQEPQVAKKFKTGITLTCYSRKTEKVSEA